MAKGGTEGECLHFDSPSSRRSCLAELVPHWDRSRAYQHTGALPRMRARWRPPARVTYELRDMYCEACRSPAVNCV